MYCGEHPKTTGSKRRATSPQTSFQTIAESLEEVLEHLTLVYEEFERFLNSSRTDPHDEIIL